LIAYDYKLPQVHRKTIQVSRSLQLPIYLRRSKRLILPVAIAGGGYYVIRAAMIAGIGPCIAPNLLDYSGSGKGRGSYRHDEWQQDS